jgi:hypothetical protein
MHYAIGGDMIGYPKKYRRIANGYKNYTDHETNPGRCSESICNVARDPEKPEAHTKKTMGSRGGALRRLHN